MKTTGEFVIGAFWEQPFKSPNDKRGNPETSQTWLVRMVDESWAANERLEAYITRVCNYRSSIFVDISLTIHYWLHSVTPGFSHYPISFSLFSQLQGWCRRNFLLDRPSETRCGRRLSPGTQDKGSSTGPCSLEVEQMKCWPSAVDSGSGLFSPGEEWKSSQWAKL